MSVWALVPASPLEEGKSRLAEALTAAERYRLNREFFGRTVAIAASVVEPSHIVVVSRSQALLGAAASLGLRTVLETPPHGLNHALTEAAAFARDRGADGVVSVSCDLPFLTEDDLGALIAAASRGGGMAIAGDRAGTGTNALVVSPVGRIPYQYGIGSLAAHRRAAASAGVSLDVVRRAGLSFDIDTPDDFEQMEEIMRDAMPIGLFASGSRPIRVASPARCAC